MTGHSCDTLPIEHAAAGRALHALRSSSPLHLVRAVVDDAIVDGVDGTAVVVVDVVAVVVVVAVDDVDVVEVDGGGQCLQSVGQIATTSSITQAASPTRLQMSWSYLPLHVKSSGHVSHSTGQFSETVSYEQDDVCSHPQIVGSSWPLQNISTDVVVDEVAIVVVVCVDVEEIVKVDGCGAG